MVRWVCGEVGVLWVASVAFFNQCYVCVCVCCLQDGSSGPADLCGLEATSSCPLCPEGWLPVLHRLAGLHQKLLLHERHFLPDNCGLHSPQELRGVCVCACV